MFKIFRRSKPEPPEKPVGEGTGTVLRGKEPAETLPKQKTGHELLEEQEWDVRKAQEYKPGDLIDEKYEVEKVFRGGMGYVYIAKSRSQDIRFAIKQPNEQVLSNKSYFSRVLHEADAWTNLGMHPHIAYCYFVKVIEKIPYIFIEYVEGGNLREWIADGKCMDIRTSLDMCIQFCHGMEHAHKKGMKHRDIKPENVLMTKEGRVKITDFGLVGQLEKGAGKQREQKEGETQLGDVMGTQAYMSPEQWENPHGVDARADIFSFGVCMWEMFCGRRPYTISIGKVPPPPDPKKLRDNLPDNLIKLLYQTIALKREERQRDFTKLREQLNSIYKTLYQQQAPHYETELLDALADELNNQGYSHYQLGDEQLARTYWEMAVKKDPQHLASNFNCGYAEWKTGEVDDEKLLTILSDLDISQPESSLRSALLCMIHLERGDLHSACVCMTNCPETIDLLPTNYKTQCLSLLHGTLHNADIQKYVSNSRLFNNSYCSSCIRTDEGIWSIDYCPRSKIVLSAGDRNIQFWDALTGTHIKSFDDYSGRFALFSRDGESVIVASGGKIFKVETISGECRMAFHEHSSSVKCISVSKDGKYLASVSENGEGRIWNIDSGKIISAFKVPGTDVQFSSNGHSILTTKGPDIYEYEISTGLLERVFSIPIQKRYWIWSAIFSPDDRYIITASSDNTVRLWDRVLSECIHIFDAPDTRSISLSPSCNILVTGNSKGILKIWDLPTYRCICTINHHSDMISSLSFLGDDKHFISGSIDKSIRIWTIEYPFRPVCNYILSLPTAARDKQKVKETFNQLLSQAESLINSGDLQNAYDIVRRAQSLPGFQHDDKVLSLVSRIARLKQ